MKAQTFVAALISLFMASTASSAPKPAKATPGKPEITRIEPRGLQLGQQTRLELRGTNLTESLEILISTDKIRAEILSVGEAGTNAALLLSLDSTLPRGPYELWAKNEKGESAKVTVHADDLPQVAENQSGSLTVLPKLPCTFWGELNPAAEQDEWEFTARAGENVVFDLAAKLIDSKANPMITLFDGRGNLLASNYDFDGGDPLLQHRFAKAGKYRLRVSEKTLAGGEGHFYRVTIGELPLVVGAFPLTVPTNEQAHVELVGINLPAKSSVRFAAPKAGEQVVPLPSQEFRSRKPLKVLVTNDRENIESEPNDHPTQANSIAVPGAASGRFGNDGDPDLFRFEATAGQTLIVETLAARRGAPVDTRIEILHADGKPVERALLQGVRDSLITFRSIDANTPDVRVENWEEMELNELLYMRGEVCKIFRMPQGPDSGFQFYTSAGKRRNYFDTTATAHANEEPCYIVEPHPPGAKLVANGLPVFTVHFANDDDAERRLGSDSRVHFVAPATAAYLVRVTDSRGFGGDRFAYRLSVREAKPDFKVTLNGASPTVPPGSGQEFSFSADRIDGFDGEIKVELIGLPAGFVASSPIVIQAGHSSASGTLFAAPDAVAPTNVASIKIRATAAVDGSPVTRDVPSFTAIKLGEKPKLLVALEPYAEGATNFVERPISSDPPSITIAPGEIVPAWLKVKRLGHDDLVSFTVENLPHGVIVDNIGLNGVLIPKEESERQIFLKAAKWVPETDRLCHSQAKQAGSPTSLPLLIRVRQPAPIESAEAR